MNGKKPSRNFMGKLVNLFWALLFLSLPFTSFPFFPPALGGAAQVRPLAVYPLFGLLLLGTLPTLWKRNLPRPLLVFMAFVLAAIISTFLAVFNDVQEIRGVSLIERSVRNLIILALGAAVYFTISLLPKNKEDLCKSLRWLYAGMVLALTWGSLQLVYVIRYKQTYFDLLNTLQRFVSTRRLFPGRISGLTFEPNWFAEQISFLLLPWLLAAVFSGYSVFRWRYRWLTLEAFLLFWSVLLLIFTFSRAGLAVMIVLVLLSLLFVRPKIRWRIGINPKLSTWFARVFMAVILLGVIVVVLFAAGSQNNYFSRLWRFWTDPEAGDSYVTYIAFGQRFVYWQTAYEMFEKYPVFGIGLGNFAFYFDELLPEQPLYKTPELLRQVTPEQGRSNLITPKNLHIKILSETGLIGTAIFIAFFISLFGCVIYLRAQNTTHSIFWARAGALGLVAFVFAAFSYDSFALPNMWVVFGLITAAANVMVSSNNHPLTQND